MHLIRRAYTLVELLVVIAIISILIGLLLPAVQKVRSAAARAKCINHLKQIGIATHQYHDDRNTMPPGWRSTNGTPGRYSSWLLHLLPYVEQSAIFNEAVEAYRLSPSAFNNPPHPGLSRVVSLFACPADARSASAHVSLRTGHLVAFTCYLGVSGRDYSTRDGVLFPDSATRFADITDGTSNTLLAGERPPSPDFQFGWWYAGVGQQFTGSADMILGVREQNLQVITAGSPCGPGAYAFQPASGFNDPCGMFHFWSAHGNGANFLFSDGSARFLSYSANALLPALASRAGQEVVTVPD